MNILMNIERAIKLVSEVNALPTAREQLERFSAMSSSDRILAAGLLLEQAGGVPVACKAPAGMFPPTVYGAEARDAYEQATPSPKRPEKSPAR